MDRNKTPLTHRITATAIAYLDGRGFKPIETEVPAGNGWIVDIASFVYPTRTEAKKLKLTDKNGVVAENQYRELMYRYDSPLTAIIEVKAAKADYKKDIDRKFNGSFYPAHLCYIAYPCGMIDEKDVPVGWYGLETTKDGRNMHRVRRAHYTRSLHPQRPGDVTDLIAQIAIRRDNRTRYAAMRALIKAYNVKDRERKETYKTGTVLSTVIDWLQSAGRQESKSLHRILRDIGIKESWLTEDKISQLEELKAKMEIVNMEEIRQVNNE